MSWELTGQHIDDLARGAALLGTGGGGDPHIGKLLLAHALDEHGPVTVLSPEELEPDAVVIPTAMMGAPTVILERLPAGTEAVAALRALEKYTGKVATATMPIECGGINSMIPLVVAAQTGLPIVDADGMGRAFPELYMETFSVYGVPGSPLALADERGHYVISDTGSDKRQMEWLARGVTIRLGAVGYIAEYCMSASDVRRTAIPGTLTLALEIGRALARARAEHPPARGLLAGCARTDLVPAGAGAL